MSRFYFFLRFRFRVARGPPPRTMRVSHSHSTSRLSNVFGGAAPPPKATFANAGQEDFWRTYVRDNHQKTQQLLRRSRSDSRLPEPPKKQWAPAAPALAATTSLPRLLPPIRQVDRFATLAAKQAEAGHRARDVVAIPQESAEDVMRRTQAREAALRRREAREMAARRQKAEAAAAYHEGVASRVAAILEKSRVHGKVKKLPSGQIGLEATETPKPARKAGRAPGKPSAIVGMASDAVNAHFSNMFKAFQYVDLDRSGKLSRDEIARALDLWNIPIDRCARGGLRAADAHVVLPTRRLTYRLTRFTSEGFPHSQSSPCSPHSIPLTHNTRTLTPNPHCVSSQSKAR